MTQPNECAFPSELLSAPGMSWSQYLLGQVVAGRLAACGGFPPTSDKGMKGFADESLKLRDAVLEAEKNNANG